MSTPTPPLDQAQRAACAHAVADLIPEASTRADAPDLIDYGPLTFGIHAGQDDPADPFIPDGAWIVATPTGLPAAGPHRWDTDPGDVAAWIRAALVHHQAAAALDKAGLYLDGSAEHPTITLEPHPAHSIPVIFRDGGLEPASVVIGAAGRITVGVDSVCDRAPFFVHVADDNGVDVAAGDLLDAHDDHDIDPAAPTYSLPSGTSGRDAVAGFSAALVAALTYTGDLPEVIA